MSDELRVAELLRRSVVKIVSPSDQGTGFVIGKRLVLTCRHVVEAVPLGGRVEIRDARGIEVGGTVRETFPAPGTVEPAERWPDLALIDLLDPEADPPAVLMDLHHVAERTAVTVGGYPAGSSVAYQTRLFTVGGSVNVDAAGHRYLALSEESVDPGMSGGPVLTPHGFVCGYVRLTRREASTLGGWVVPISEVVYAIPALRAAFDDPGPAALPWTNLIGSERLKDHQRFDDGRRFDADEPAPTMIDIYLVRAGQAPSPVSEWEVCVATQPPQSATVRTADLGEGVLEAVDQWSRRRPIGEVRQVELLGRVFHRALMPPAIAQVVADRSSPGRSFLRLRIDQANELAAIPWEYARSERGEFLATSASLVFVRYVDKDAVPVSPGELARVLVVVNLPSAELSEALAARIEAEFARSDRYGRLEVHVERSLDFDTFGRLLEQDGPWDVVHYVGGGLGETAIGFVGYGGDPASSTPIDLATVTAAVRTSAARVVVMQLQPAPMHTSPTAAHLLPLFDANVRAVVVAEHASTADHVMGFATAFYEELALGQSVEESVQTGRRRLQNTAPPLGLGRDHAAFATVTVTTTRNGDIRLLTGRPRAERRSSPQLPILRSVFQEGP